MHITQKTTKVKLNHTQLAYTLKEGIHVNDDSTVHAICYRVSSDWLQHAESDWYYSTI